VSGSCAPACITSLANVGAGDFRIQFSVTTTATAVMELVSQRGTCSHGVFWDLRMLSSGVVFAETDDGTARYTALPGTRRINDGAPHLVVVARAAGVLSIAVDGAADVSAPSTSVLAALAPLSVSSICRGLDTTAPFSGSLTGLCLTTP
jgi:hypothetical protein